MLPSALLAMIGVGITTPGEWLLQVKSVETGWYIPLTVIVTPPVRERPRQ